MTWHAISARPIALHVVDAHVDSLCHESNGIYDVAGDMHQSLNTGPVDRDAPSTSAAGAAAGAVGNGGTLVCTSGRARWTLPATSRGAIFLKIRGFKMRRVTWQEGAWADIARQVIGCQLTIEPRVQDASR
jgi:hypothetical protein